MVRFLSNLWTLLAGSLLLSACFAFGAGTLGWLGLAAGCAVLVVLLGAFAVRGRGWPQRGLDLLTAILASWTIVAARAFTGSSLRWLTVGEAFALLGLGVLGLVIGQIQLRAAVTRGRARGRRLESAHPLGPAPVARRAAHPLTDRR